MTEVEVHKVRITERGVELDGHDVKHVAGLQYTALPGQPAQLNLKVWAFDGVIESEDVIVSTIVQDPKAQVASGAEAILEFLGRINPNELDSEVLNRMDWSPATNGELVLEVLREWATK